MKNHNAIQKDCTNLESDLELAVGEIYGMRHWSIKKAKTGKPYLGGHWGGTWSTTEPNVATCAVDYENQSLRFALPHIYGPEYIRNALDLEIRKMFNSAPTAVVALITLDGHSESMWALRDSHLRQLAQTDDYTIDGGEIPWSLSDEPMKFNSLHPSEILNFTISVTTPRPPHRATEPSCTCGFYAYSSPRALFQNTPGTTGVFGLVKAYGRVTQGSKGFRAEKMEIVGLTSPLFPHRNNEWLPAQDYYLLEDFESLVPKTMPVYKNMHELFAAAQPLIEPRFEL